MPAPPRPAVVLVQEDRLSLVRRILGAEAEDMTDAEVEDLDRQAAMVALVVLERYLETRE